MDLKQKTHKIIELTLWIAVISALILTNLSFTTIARVVSKQYFLILLIILGAIILVALDKISRRKFFLTKRLLFDIPAVCVVALLIYIIYNFVDFDYALFFIPIILAIALSTLVVIDTRWVTIGLVVVTCFLLGQVYWEEEFSTTTILTFPVAFLRIFSLSLVVLFGYYLYKMRDEAVHELRDRNKQLTNIKRRLESRTKELSELNKRLEALDKLKSKFISTVSHELRTPLTAIFSSAELLKKMHPRQKSQSKDMNDLIDLIMKNTKRQTVMIENLLNLSRIEKGQAEGRRLKVRVEELAREAIESLVYQAESKSIKFDLRLPHKLPSIWCVPDQIRRVFINLINNSIKYSPHSSKIIIKIVDENGSLKCMVRDFGPGIKKEDLVKIFDRFLQISSPGKEGGVGLGLAICKEIIQAHGGQIWAESELGKGSKFIFKIPKDLRKGERK